MTLNEFQKQVFAGLFAIQNDLADKPLSASIPAQKDFPALLASVRKVADEMALCATLDSAINALREDQAGLLGVLFLTSEISESDVILAVRRAYASSPQDSSALPGYPVAAYLIQLCDDLELVSRRPPKDEKPHSPPTDNT
jgi:hypothetical protein